MMLIIENHSVSLSFWRRFLLGFAMVVAFVSSGFLQAQPIPRIPQHACAGDSFLIELSHVSLTTLGHHDRVFLPDGEPCGDDGCSYISSVDFNAFPDTALLRSVNDINYLRLNIEHSWIGDIYIELKCPNGQHASLMNWSHGGSSFCTDSVPVANSLWQGDYPNVYVGTHFGETIRKDGTPTCDSTVYDNRPFVGWNYCWSNSTTAGITYAPGPGALIYRAEHGHDGAVDSSDVASRSNFYHPEEHFSSLIGCPLNGVWSIEVIDAWRVDNGYIFGWDLSLNSNRLEIDTCAGLNVSLTGPWLTALDGVFYRLSIPDTLEHDTTVSYHYVWLDDCGNSIDTTYDVTIRVPADTMVALQGCPMATWRGVGYIFDTSFVSRLTTVYGCDSLVDVNVTVGNHSYIHLYDTICRWDSYVFHGDTCAPRYVYNTYTYRYPEPNASGCDSLEYLHLYAQNVVSVVFRDTIVENQLPYVWDGITFTTNVREVQYTLTSSFGCDSIVSYSLMVLLNSHERFDTAVCADYLPLSWRGMTFSEADTKLLVLPAANGADSIVEFALSCLPSYHDTVQGMVCLPSGYSFGDSVYMEEGLYSMALESSEGCDSVIVLDLVVGRMVEVETVDTFCFNRQYVWRGQTVGGEDDAEHHYRLTDTVHVPGQCDTAETLYLVQLSRPTLVLSDSVDCQRQEHLLRLETDMPYRRWRASDGTYVADDDALSAVVKPTHEGVVYWVTVDRRPDVYCPLSTPLKLSPVKIPEAKLKILPEVVTLDALDFNVYDATHGEVVERVWYLDGERHHSDSSPLVAYADGASDSVIVTLEVFNGYCRDTVDGVLRVMRISIFAPNVFTPDQETNNRFAIVTQGVEAVGLDIYNRNGLLVYRTDRPLGGWDGRALDGRACPQANYVWLLRYCTADYPTVTRTATGSVLLLR